jgi:hypothetical protein
LWEKEYHRVNKQIEECKTELEKKSKKTNLEILRVNQLDALTLDTEIEDLVGSQFMSIFSFFHVYHPTQHSFTSLARISSKIQARAHCPLRITHFSLQHLGHRHNRRQKTPKPKVCQQRVLFHSHLFLTFRCAPISKLQKFAYATLLIGGKWAWSRINTWASTRDYGGSMRSLGIWKSLGRVETLYKVLSLLNFVVFLYDSKYPFFCVFS